jgi:RNA 3'-terminal phosphate cyclase (GTP)
MTEINRIEIDGNHGEGGGQIVRTALALSVLTKKPFYISNIRKGRKTPGLKRQHLHSIKALEQLCGATTIGAEEGSTELHFSPSKLKPQTLSIDIGTAGSITLLMQSLLLPCIFGGGKYRLRIKGGTDVAWSMPADYLREVIIPTLKRYSDIDCLVESRGYYPAGGGRIDIKIKGKHTLENISEVPPLRLTEAGNLIQIKGISHASTDLEGAQVAARQAHAAKITLSKLGCPVSIETSYNQAISTGSGITLWAISTDPKDPTGANPFQRIGADALGEKGKRAEAVGEEAATKLIAEIKSHSAVDSNQADNIIPLMGLIGGTIKTSEISKHTISNIYVTEKFLDVKFQVDEKNNTITCDKQARE